MSKHTPGPWAMINRKVVTAAGDGVASILVGMKGYSESTANLRLMAAAPDLLDVVKGFRRKLETYVNVYPGDKELRRLLSNCDAAIAKATGENQ